MTRRVETSPRSATRVLRACQVSVTGVRHDSSAARASVTAPDRRARSAKRKKREKSVGPRAASPREAVRRRVARTRCAYHVFERTTVRDASRVYHNGATRDAVPIRPRRSFARLAVESGTARARRLSDAAGVRLGFRLGFHPGSAFRTVLRVSTAASCRMPRFSNGAVLLPQREPRRDRRRADGGGDDGGQRQRREAHQDRGAERRGHEACGARSLSLGGVGDGNVDGRGGLRARDARRRGRGGVRCREWRRAAPE